MCVCELAVCVCKRQHWGLKPCHCHVILQALRYFDYVFTGVFTFEMIIKVGIHDGLHAWWSLKLTSILRGSETKYYDLDYTLGLSKEEYYTTSMVLKKPKKNVF